MTSEKGEEFFSEKEISRITANIGRRIIEAFNYQPDAEIAFILKTSCTTVKSYTENEELPTVEMLLSIHKMTGVSIHWLLTGEGTKYANFGGHLIASEELMHSGLA